ncbi:hypothetical protein [Sphingobacterium siyangense]|uniref:hypothetical protein n=1 Tax=Sphingobacterium siyangense TaxID=459529 RepID=UPI00301A8427
MARTISQIQDEIKTAIQARSELADLTSTSKSAIWLAMTYAIAFVVFTVESLFDLHKSEVENTLSLLKPHTQRWYREKAKLFQYGYSLVTDTDVYDNSSLTDQQVEDSKIIKYCAVNEATEESRLIVKIATSGSTGDLEPIGPNELIAFKAYINEVKDAGLTITITNYLPDILLLDMIIFYDPLIFNGSGETLIGGTKPVEIAVKEFLSQLPFNGVLQLNLLAEALRTVQGVEIPHIVKASSRWINPALGGYGEPIIIDVYKIPESGYFKVDDFSQIKYQAYEKSI